jgi:hypothetical protein
LQTLAPQNRIDLNQLYIPPLATSWRGCGETLNTPNGSEYCEDMRGDIARVAPDSPLTPSTPYPSGTWWKWSSSRPGLWDCRSNLYQTLSRHSLIRVTLAAYHDMTIFVLPLWWMLCLWDYLWDAKMFMFLMYE